jgi:hypothetical protein
LNAKSLRKNSLAVFAGAFLFAGQASAITVTDPMNTLQNTLNNFQDIEHRIAEEIERQANRMLEKELSKVGIESEAQKSAQELLAKQRLEENLRNQEVARQQAPLMDVCKDSAAFTFAFDGDIDCYRMEKTDAAIEKMEERQNVGYEASNEEENAAINQEVEDKVVACFDYLHSEGANAQGVSPSDSHCFDSTVLTDSNMTTIQSGVEEVGAEYAVEMIVEPVIRKKPFGSNDLSTSVGRKKFLNEKRKDMLLALAQSVMLHNVEIRRSSKWADAEKTQPLPSVLETLESFNRNRLMSAGGEYLLKLGAAHKDKFSTDEEVAIESTFTIEQVQRETAVMTAFLSHMAVLQYKSQLRIEQLEAAILSVEVNPPE